MGVMFEGVTWRIPSGGGPRGPGEGEVGGQAAEAFGTAVTTVRSKADASGASRLYEANHRNLNREK